MKKTWIILDSVFLIVFNAFFFILGGVDQCVSAWISYGFIHFAYLMLLITPRFIHSGKSAAILGLSLYAISSTYFLVVLITGMAFILIAPEGYKTALLVQLLISGIYVSVFTSNIIANKYTAEAEEKRQHEIDYVKKASSELSAIINFIDDREIKKGIEKVYDAIYSSPVKSHPNVIQIESNILILIKELRIVVESSNKESIINLEKTLFAAINERNSQLKMLN